MNTRLAVISSLVLALLLAAAYFLFFSAKPAAPPEDALADTGTPIEEGTISAAGVGKSTFTHPVLGFSLQYPKELTVAEYDEGQGARTIVFQKPEEEEGFQMFIVPYAQLTISEARLTQDLKGAAVEGLTDIVVAGNVPASMFWSQSPIIGKSREVWFIKDGHLYEVTTYAAHDAWLAGIMATLRFTAQ